MRRSNCLALFTLLAVATALLASPLLHLYVALLA